MIPAEDGLVLSYVPNPDTTALRTNINATNGAAVRKRKKENVVRLMHRCVDPRVTCHSLTISTRVLIGHICRCACKSASRVVDLDPRPILVVRAVVSDRFLDVGCHEQCWTVQPGCRRNHRSPRCATFGTPKALQIQNDRCGHGGSVPLFGE